MMSISYIFGEVIDSFNLFTGQFTYQILHNLLYFAHSILLLLIYPKEIIVYREKLIKLCISAFFKIEKN